MKTIKAILAFLGVWGFIGMIFYLTLTKAAAELANAPWRRSALTSSSSAGPSRPFNQGPAKALVATSTDSAATAANLLPLFGTTEVTFNPSHDEVKVVGCPVVGLDGGQFNIEFDDTIPGALEVSGSLDGDVWHKAIASKYPDGYAIYESEADALLMLRWKPGEKRPDHDYVVRVLLTPPKRPDRVVGRYVRHYLRPEQMLDFQPPHQTHGGGGLTTDIHVAVCYDGGRLVPPGDLTRGDMVVLVDDTIGAFPLKKPYLTVPGLSAPHLVLGNRLPEAIDVYVTTVAYPR